MACIAEVSTVIQIPGPQGVRGERGSDGNDGGIGPMGPSGASIVGPAGPAGVSGIAGQNGVSAFTTTSANFNQPAVGATVVVTVASSAMFTIGQPVFMQNGGSYVVTALPSATQITLQNLGYAGNAAVAALVTSGKLLTPSGLIGAAGANGTNGSSALGANYFRADKNAVNQAMVVGGDIGVNFLTERFDPSGVFAASTWTCPTTGFYQFEVRLLWDTDPGTLSFSLYLNGGPGFGTVLIPGTVTARVGLLYSGVVSMTAGDFVQVYATQASGAGATILGTVTSTWISGMRIA